MIDSVSLRAGLYRLRCTLLLLLLLSLCGFRLCGTAGSVPADVRIFLKILQLPGIGIDFQVGTEGLPVVFQPFDKQSLAILEVRFFLCREHVPVNLRRNTRSLLLVESVRRVFISSLTNEENSSPLRPIMFSR